METERPNSWPVSSLGCRSLGSRSSECAWDAANPWEPKLVSRICLFGILIVVGLFVAGPVGAQADSGLTALFVASGDGHSQAVSPLLSSGEE